MQGAEANKRDLNGCTALMVAAAEGHQEAADWLMTGGAEAILVADSGLSAMELAEREGHGALAGLIEESLEEAKGRGYGEERGGFGIINGGVRSEALREVAKQGDVAATRHLLRTGGGERDVYTGRGPLLESAVEGEVTTFRSYVACGEKIDDVDLEGQA